MSLPPLVTVGIASFNNARYVLETLKSVVSQSYKNIEIVVVDDCSSDNSFELIEEFLRPNEFPSKLIRHEKNMGVVAVCNRLLQEVRGEYYCFVGSDDVFYPEKIARQMEVMSWGGDDLVFSAMDYIGAEGEPMEMRNFNRLPDISGPFVLTWAFLLGGSFITAPTAMLKTAATKKAGGYNPDFSIEDMPLWVRLAGMGASFYYISEPLVKYRIYSASLSSKLSTLISHTRLVAFASKKLKRSDRLCVMTYMLHRIVSNNDSNAELPPISDSRLLFWACSLNQTRLGHFLLYKYLDRMVRKPAFIQRLESIKKQMVFNGERQK
jgi:alpha-1,3-rhamnosyltransferase